MNVSKVLRNTRSYCCWWLFDRPEGLPLVRVVGDSHVKAFFGARGFYVHHIGAATAYNLCEPCSSTRSRERLMRIARGIDRDREVLMLSFGEIDCRIHIFGQFKRRGEKESMAALIGRTVERYGQVLQELRRMGVHVVVYGIVPATRQGNRYEVEHYASPDMHVHIYREFNARLREYCDRNELVFIDIQEAASDTDGFIAPGFAHGDAHLNWKVVPIVSRLLTESGVWNRKKE